MGFTEVNYYFSYSTESVLYFILFVGQPAVYGGGGMDNNDFSDMDFVATTNSNIEPQETPGLQQVLAVTNKAKDTYIRLYEEVGTPLETFHEYSPKGLVYSRSNKKIKIKYPLYFNAQEVEYNIPSKFQNDTFAMLSDIPDNNWNWGNIGGSLSAQTDLLTVLNNKGTLLSGNTWTGAQTFERVTMPDNSIITNLNINRFFLQLGSALQGGVMARNTSDSASVLNIANNNSNSTGNIINYISNIDNVTLDRAGVRKDGRTFGSDGTSTNDYVTVGQISDFTGNFSWGSINGDIYSQTDLQLALNNKINNPSGTDEQYIMGNGTLGNLSEKINYTQLQFLSLNPVSIAVNDTLVGAFGKTQGQLNTKAPLVSPTFSGTPSVPTASVGTNTTQIASTAFVRQAISAATSGSTVSAWGAITGTLSAQTDLQLALNGKFNNPTGTANQYIKGNGVLGNFNNDILSATVSGLTLTNSNISNGDTILASLGKLQQQNNTISASTINNFQLSPSSDKAVKFLSFVNHIPASAQTNTAYFIEDNSVSVKGSLSISANGSTMITIPHTLGLVPVFVDVRSKSFSSSGITYVTADSNNIKVHYQNAPVGMLDYWINYTT